MRARVTSSMKPWSPEDLSEDTDHRPPSTDHRPSSIVHLDLWLLALILGVTVSIRLWELGTVPVDVMPDEADYLNVIYRTILGIGPKFFEFTFDWSQTALNNYIQTAFVQLFGLNNTIVGLRMSAVAMSIPAVIPFYFLLRGSFGRWTALFTTLLFASSWWYLNLSRTAWVNTFVVSNGLMALWLIELALRASTWRRSLLYWSLTGLFTSICLYGYAAGKVLVFSICLYVGLQWLLAFWDRRFPRIVDPYPKIQNSTDDPTAPGELARPMWHRPPPRPALTFVGAVLFVLVAIATFLPQVPAILQYWDNYIDRPRAVSITNVQLPYEGLSTMEEVYRQQVRKVFDGWILMRGLENVPPNVLIRYNPPGEPFLDPVSRVLFMVGMLLSLLMLRRSVLWWILWLLGLAITQVLTTDIPNAARAVIVIPSVFYFVACSIYWILKLLAYFSGRESKDDVGARHAVSSPRWLPAQSAYNPPVVPKSPPRISSRAALALAALVCLGLVVYNVRHYWDWMHLPLTADARQPSVELDEFEEWQYLQWQLATTNRGAFSVDHWHVLRREQPVGLVVAYFRTPDWIAPPDWLRRGSPAALVADSPVVGPEPYSVRWKGLLRVPADGEYIFTCGSEGVCEFSIGGKTILSKKTADGSPPGAAGDATSSITLSTGPHPIELRYSHRDPQATPRFDFQWQGPGIAKGAIPVELLAPSKYALNP